MSGILNKAITLVLNSNWKPIGYRTVQDAIVKLTGSEKHPEPSALAMDIDYPIDDHGNPVYESPCMNPISWKDWINLPIRDWDLTISGTNGKLYRVPTVIIAVKFSKMPKRTFSDFPSNQNIMERDNFTCQITNQKLPKEMLTIDHVIPKSRGGGEGWENKVTCRKDINYRKGNKLNSEVGITLIRTPTKPSTTHICDLIDEARVREHEFFVMKK
jgi:hypothetical protein